MSENCIAIINSLVKQRHEKNMTQEDLANACHLTQSVIARLESKKSIPRLDTLLKIANALDFDLVLLPNIP